jgi:sugar phosphate isomerase/epimerase
MLIKSLNDDSKLLLSFYFCLLSLIVIFCDINNFLIIIFILIAMKTKQSRRDFLRVTGTGALGAMVIMKSNWRSLVNPAARSNDVDLKKFGIGLQLYTIREAMEKDVPGSLKKVSDIGYKYVELANYANGKFYGYDPLEFRKMVNDLGMEILSSHAGVSPMGISDDEAKKMAEDHAKLGAKYCMQPWIEEADRNSIAGYQKMVAEWNKVGRIMKENGVLFGYHNHDFEFATVEGKIPYYDVFLPEMDKDFTTMELDLFWATKAGQDPVEIFKKYPGRFQLFHMKDMLTKNPPIYTTNGVDDFAPVGTGLIDFKRILAAKKIAGMKYMFVEQDNAGKNNPFEDIKTSITNLTTKILV